MNDTDLKSALMLHQMMLNKSPEERFMMGCSMFSFAKNIVKSSILANNKHISPGELKKHFFLRFYGNEMDDKTRKKIAKYFSEMK